MNSFNIGTTVVANKEVQVRLPPAFLTKHTALFGASGSGKTGAILSLVEECIESETPVVLIDIKGDMSNIILREDTSNINFKLITPGGEHGDAINIFHGLSKKDRIQNSVSSILKMVGESGDPIQNKMHAFLSQILAYMHKHKLPTELDTIVNQVMEPPFTSFGALELDLAIPRASRAKLASKLNTLFVAPSMTTWREGEALDINACFTNTPGKTNVTVYSVAHIVDEDQRQFAVAIILDEILAWTRAQSGTDTLRALLIIDECVGILPPHPAAPPTKRPLMTLLKQARAYGLGCVLSTQNTVDIDYKALANCETWIVGKLTMKRDRMRLIDAIMAQTNHPREVLDVRIAGLEHRNFLLVRPKKVISYTTNSTKANLQGPMTPMELERVYTSYKSNH